MGDVRIDINGQGYTIGCADGEEDRLADLARRFDARVRELAASAGNVAEARLLILAGLTVFEELDTAKAAIGYDPARIAGRLDAMAKRIEGVADDLSPDGRAEDPAQ